tara:strand:+ start:340 stop:645 length:306 start_codon:yes stop_codon:yes gene_type:complete
MWSGALGRPDILLSHGRITLALHITIILIITHQSTPKSTDQHRYITQIGARPPKFLLFTNLSTPELPGHFERFLRSKIQQDFDLKGVCEYVDMAYFVFLEG